MERRQASIRVTSPPASWKAELSTSREQTNRYKKANIKGTLRKEIRMDLVLAHLPRAAKEEQRLNTVTQ